MTDRVENSSGRAARKLRLALMGPAFIAAIGFSYRSQLRDQYSYLCQLYYQPLWVVVWANLMAMLIQILGKTRNRHGQEPAHKFATIIRAR